MLTADAPPATASVRKKRRREIGTIVPGSIPEATIGFVICLLRVWLLPASFAEANSGGCCPPASQITATSSDRSQRVGDVAAKQVKSGGGWAGSRGYPTMPPAARSEELIRSFCKLLRISQQSTDPENETFPWNTRWTLGLSQNGRIFLLNFPRIATRVGIPADQPCPATTW